MDSLISLSKIIILLVMILIAVVALFLSIRLQRFTSPLSAKLIELHQSDCEQTDLGDRLQRIRERYISLLSKVDHVDATEFSAGELETVYLSCFNRDVSAASAQSWLRQAPGILISLGLLGTFAGLTVGLTRISDILSTRATTEVAGAVKSIIEPMGTAFETSLIGLFLSLFVLIWTQITGTRDCLERCEALLTSWLETVLPAQLGNKVLSPLRQSIGDLNSTVSQLPGQVYQSVQSGMQEAFEAKLADMFDSYSLIATEAQSAVRQIAAVSVALSESGQDFIDAAHAFRDSRFASTLQHSVQSLHESREAITNSTELLSNRLLEVRDGLLTTQAEWRLLGKTAEQELESCRLANQAIQSEVKTLAAATTALEQGTQSATDATKQLREARLEVQRDRKLSIEVAESVRARLATDSSVAESCQVFVQGLETALSNWNLNVQRLDGLMGAFITSVKNAKLEDEAILADRSKMVRETIERLRDQLQEDLGSAIETQRAAVNQIGKPAQSAQMLSEQLVGQLTDLQQRLTGISALGMQSDPQDNRGN